jgi:prepilin-type N-terminal cleavage/methylation domain-containing protein
VRLSDDRGHTLVELLVAMLVGTIVLMAIFALVDTTTKTTAKTTDRMETLARTRAASEIVRAHLRSAVCPDDGTSPVITAQDSEISFVSRLQSRPSGVPTTEARIQRRTIDLSGGNVRERVYDQTAGAGSVATFNATPSRTATLLDRADTPAGQPLFTYLDDDGDAITDAALRTKASRVRVQLVGKARRAEPGLDARSDATVVLRLDDPTDPDNSPEC